MKGGGRGWPLALRHHARLDLVHHLARLAPPAVGSSASAGSRAGSGAGRGRKGRARRRLPEGDAPAEVRPVQFGIEQRHRRSECRPRRPASRLPLMARSMRPRRRGGLVPWIAELIAEYSPPLPAPVRKRKNRELSRFHREGGRRRRSPRWTPSVTLKSFLRPSLSGEMAGRRSGPSTAPIRWALPVKPTCSAVRCNRGLVCSAAATELQGDLEAVEVR